MLKREMIEAIIWNTKKVRCTIQRVYGVSWGVGYDLNVLIEYDNKTRQHLDAHATHASWSMGGHLRPNQIPFKKYTGCNDFYREKVVIYWEKGNGYKEYLERFLKPELTTIYNKVVV